MVSTLTCPVVLSEFCSIVSRSYSAEKTKNNLLSSSIYVCKYQDRTMQGVHLKIDV